MNTKRVSPGAGDDSGVARLRRMGPPPAASFPYLLALTRISGVGVQTVANMVADCGSAESAWFAPLTAFSNSVDRHRAIALVEGRASLDPATLWAEVASAGVTVLVFGTQEYPKLLAHTAAPPILLYVRGDPNLLHADSIAVVGTRRMTRYGDRVTRRVARDLARYGVTVVSGMARGVDTAAHEAALDAGGATAAVLGCGVDVAFPSSNARLLDRIAAAGVVVSEYPPGSPALRGNFPARNRIIAGLASATVVVEAGDPSGALITAAVAADEGRSVCAVPGPAGGAATAGTHLLLRTGASAVASAAEILMDAGLEYPDGGSGNTPTGEAAQAVASWTDASGGAGSLGESAGAVLSRLRHGPASVDELADELRTAPSQVNRCLTVLELEGLARACGAGEWEAA